MSWGRDLGGGWDRGVCVRRRGDRKRAGDTEESKRLQFAVLHTHTRAHSHTQTDILFYLIIFTILSMLILK